MLNAQTPQTAPEPPAFFLIMPCIKSMPRFSEAMLTAPSKNNAKAPGQVGATMTRRRFWLFVAYNG
jgi:hypothetical protein